MKNRTLAETIGGFYGQVDLLLNMDIAKQIEYSTLICGFVHHSDCFIVDANAKQSVTAVS